MLLNTEESNKFYEKYKQLKNLIMLLDEIEKQEQIAKGLLRKTAIKGAIKLTEEIDQIIFYDNKD